MRHIEIRAGSGAEAAPGKRYIVHYTGWLADGTKFDSSVDRNEPFDFVQGRRQVIAGWDTGFEGMRVGGKRRLLIPYQLAYGEAGAGPIPPKADLIFDVELLDVKDAPATPAGIDVLLPLEEMEKKVLALARAVPEEKYNWRPAPGVRSFGEVMRHIELGNRLLLDIAMNGYAAEKVRKQAAANAAAEKENPGKEKILASLEESFAAVRKSIGQMRAGALGREQDYFGAATTRRGVFVYLDTHVAEHLGQAIAYARMNGVAPPWSRE